MQTQLTLAGQPTPRPGLESTQSLAYTGSLMSAPSSLAGRVLGFQKYDLKRAMGDYRCETKPHAVGMSV